MADKTIDTHQICSDSDCTGCAVCSAACPEKAVSMELDKQGFWRPRINMSLCINCNRCNQICPVNNPPEKYGPTRAFAYQNLDSIRLNSTSGGFFNAIANKVIEEGGAVCGASFDKNMVLKHVIVEKREDLEPLQKSKYVQSWTGDIYKSVKLFLNEGRKVLFVGVGCQAAALRKYIGMDENLIIIDLVCYGVPSPGIFRDWIQYLEQKYDQVKDVRFRDKSYGYATPNVKVLFQNGSYIESNRDSNMYTDLFFRHLIIRNSCYNCRFKSVDRTSDITLGDLWVIGRYDKAKDDNKGTTVAFSHTKQGNMLCKEICTLELDTKEIISRDSRKMTESVSPSQNKDIVWKVYEEKGFDGLIKYSNPKTLKSTLKYGIKQFLNKTRLSTIIYRIQKAKKI